MPPAVSYGPTTLSRDTIRRAPKAVLHDHLDGGLRPATLAELAESHGYAPLAGLSPDQIAALMAAGGTTRDLVGYLEGFAHTVALTQDADTLARVAYEAVEDLAADGVVYAEVRFAPELHDQRGLDLGQVIDAVSAGVRDGAAATGCTTRVLVCAMRSGDRSLEVAQAAVAAYQRGHVAGFDIAGAEAGYRASAHRDAFALCAHAHMPTTVHAGEGFGLASIAEALHDCGAVRLGHGVRIAEDIDDEQLGPIAAWVRDRRVPLELCPTSNINTGIYPSLDDHPVDTLARLRFRVTINTDNRLMSATTMTDELMALHTAFGWGWAEMEWVTVNAVKSAFSDFDTRAEIIDNIIRPGYAGLGTAH